MTRGKSHSHLLFSAIATYVRRLFMIVLKCRLRTESFINDFLLCLILVLLSMIIITIALTSIARGVCVNNLSCRAIHAELYRRTDCTGFFGTNSCFSKRVNTNSKECCDAGNQDCWRTSPSADDALYWIDCDTDAHTQGFGQTVVACANCEINVYDNGMIVVNEEGGSKKTRAVYSCKY